MRDNRKVRMNRLFGSGRCLDVAIDHGVCNEPSFLDGLEDMPAGNAVERLHLGVFDAEAEIDRLLRDPGTEFVPFDTLGKAGVVADLVGVDDLAASTHPL